MFDQGIEAARAVWQQAGPTDLTLVLVGLAVFVGTVLMTGAALVLIILAKLAIAVLLALGPVFIMLYLFGATRGFFEGWIRQLANFALLIVLTFGVLALILKIIEPSTTALAAKGAAVRRFMAIPPFAGRRPVFLGDDTSDENGFEAINEAGGISIRVKPRGPTAANYILDDVNGAIAWLKVNFASVARAAG